MSFLANENALRRMGTSLCAGDPSGGVGTHRLHTRRVREAEGALTAKQPTEHGCVESRPSVPDISVHGSSTPWTRGMGVTSLAILGADQGRYPLARMTLDAHRNDTVRRDTA